MPTIKFSFTEFMRISRYCLDFIVQVTFLIGKCILIFKSYFSIFVKTCMLIFDLLFLTTGTVIFRYFNCTIEVFIYNFKGQICKNL